MTTKREDCKIEAMEMKFLRAISNKTKKGRIRNASIRLELEVDKIKKDIQKSRLGWFEPAMWIREDKTPKENATT